MICCRNLPLEPLILGNVDQRAWPNDSTYDWAETILRPMPTTIDVDRKTLLKTTIAMREGDDSEERKELWCTARCGNI